MLRINSQVFFWLMIRKVIFLRFNEKSCKGNFIFDIEQTYSKYWRRDNWLYQNAI